MKKYYYAIFLVLLLTVPSTLNGLAAATLSKSGSAAGADAGPALSTNQIIIQYKTLATARQHPAAADQMQRMSQAAGISLQYGRSMSGSAHVLRLPQRLPLEQVQAIAARLMTAPDVAYAEPDRKMYLIGEPHERPAAPVFRPLLLNPDDSQYSNQWDLYDTWGINAPPAWDITTGAAGVVVAVIDTGITGHTEFSGRTVPGYDFICCTLDANDGDGPDGDPSDPGDWITQAEHDGSYFGAFCPVTASSWHGTHTAGTIGAAGNNGLGVAGINWNSKILPVRVLGKCGGYSSDILDGMRWAAGLLVPGAPPNTHPAKVLNLSLGGPSPCEPAYQDAINEITAAGAVVVVAAGNSGVDANSFEPANCNGVITVAATGHSGNKASYSNYGSTIEISAPGGDGLFGILSTFNAGTQGPVAGDTYADDQGTSMAAPHVSGAASLLFSLKPSLTPAQVLQILQNTARPFPGGGSCSTTPNYCGSGIVDAGAAVAYEASQLHETISGNLGVAGATVTYTGGTTTSALDGSYSFQVPYKWNGAVTPTKACYIFNPLSRSYTDVVSDQPAQNYTYTIDPNPACATFDVLIGGVPRGSYGLPLQGSLRVNYAGVDSGPVRVTSTNAVPIISAIREAWAVNGVTTSFSQLMGLPAGQLSDRYVFPGYNNVTLNDQLRIGNVDTVPTTVVVTIGGVPRGSYLLQPDEAVRINYPGLDSGPVIVDGTDGVNIISAIREAWAVNGTTRSFVQLMGLSATQLSDQYVFPAYNNVTLNDQLRIGNVDTVPSTVIVTIGGVPRGSYTLQPDEAVRINYAGLDSGPVVVQGTLGVKIISAIREAWAVNGVTTSFSQLMGMPATQLSDQYVFPAYNNVTLNEQLRIGNVDTVPSTVTVTIGGVFRGSYTLQANEAVRVNYAGLDSGPVVVQGTAGVHIISAIREAWAVNGVTQSFVQLMGLPFGQLSSTYLFPGYNNVTLNDQLRIAVP